MQISKLNYSFSHPLGEACAPGAKNLKKERRYKLVV